MRPEGADSLSLEFLYLKNKEILLSLDFFFLLLNICLKENLILSGVRPISTSACGTY